MYINNGGKRNVADLESMLTLYDGVDGRGMNRADLFTLHCIGSL